MVNKRGNPAWYRGMPSANPQGRPRGQNSTVVLNSDPIWFVIKHSRWERFCFTLLDPPYTGAAAARSAGYSPKSARFIASRLIRKPVIHELLRRIHLRIEESRKIDDGVYFIPDYNGKYSVYTNKNIAKKAREEVEVRLKKYR